MKNTFKAPEPKVAVLRIPASDWDNAPAGGQLLFLMQQMLSFMASPAFVDFEGLQVQVIDTQNIAKCQVVLQIGEKPGSGLIEVN